MAVVDASHHATITTTTTTTTTSPRTGSPDDPQLQQLEAATISSPFSSSTPTTSTSGGDKQIFTPLSALDDSHGSATEQYDSEDVCAAKVAATLLDVGEATAASPSLAAAAAEEAAAPSPPSAEMEGSVKRETLHQQQPSPNKSTVSCAADPLKMHQTRLSPAKARQYEGHNQHHNHPGAHGSTQNTTSASPALVPSQTTHGHQSDSLFSSSESPPLRIGSVQPDTQMAHPKPISRPTSKASNAGIRHPIPDPSTPRGRAYTGSNVAQLEATAAQMSMTSSIDDAIRDLHGELKRSDSKRSSILAAQVRAASTERAGGSEPSTVSQLKRHLSTSSSIVSTNIAARHGGYSPAAYIMSPNESLSNRLRSTSRTSAGRPDFDSEPILSRHGPGKASVRSVRSSKLSLQEISESEPSSLTQAALDEADFAPPIEQSNDDNDDDTTPQFEPPTEDASSTDAFHRMIDGSTSRTYDSNVATAPVHREPQEELERAQRPSSTHSGSTYAQAQDAFVDFDGVHWESETELELPLGPPGQTQEELRGVGEPQSHLSVQHATPRLRTRPQSYFDPSTGQQMLYYPARVPAMLNLPPKLSSGQAAKRAQRQSQVLGAMAGPSRRRSAMPNMMEGWNPEGSPEQQRNSWLPDPLAGQRNSFAGLSALDHSQATETRSMAGEQQDSVQNEAETHEGGGPADGLRRPQRLSRNNPTQNNRQSTMSQMDNLPSQLRASAFFDLPPAPPEVEAKNGSAMDTLDSILDASAHAPVGAFTDHAYAGKLGSETYGKAEKKKQKQQQKRQSHAAAATLQVVPAEEETPKKRHSSFLWFGKRRSSYNEKPQASASVTSLESRHDEAGEAESQAPSHGAEGEEDAGSDASGSTEEDEPSIQGPPSTLLAELLARQKDQKKRTQHQTQAFPNGMQATLLEMDAVAETQRKKKVGKRVNLAWEDPYDHRNRNGSDDGESDDEVPLAIIAAKHLGAKNKADLEQPIGLIGQRDLEENEPLSHRRARLQGRERSKSGLAHRLSTLNMSALRLNGANTPASMRAASTPELHEDELETLGQRKLRLEEQEGEAEDRLPAARPVSSSFSAELLSHFGDKEGTKETSQDGPGNREQSNATPEAADGEEETLGQRRRRLQAEREAREREMSYGNLTGNKRMSLANVLSAHPRRDPNTARAQQETRRAEEQARYTQDQDVKMGAWRGNMPTNLTAPNVERSGGFRGGQYNDGTGGTAGAARHQPSRSVSTAQLPGMGTSPAGVYNNGFYENNRASVSFSNFGAMAMQQPQPQPQPSPYGGGMYGYNGNVANMSMGNLTNMYGGMAAPAGMMSPYGGMSTPAMSPYGGMQTPMMGMYGAGQAMGMGMGMGVPMQTQTPQMSMQMPVGAGPIDRVERWRQSIHP